MKIVPANQSHADVILKYIHDLATEESFPYPVTVTKADLLQNLLSESAHATAVILQEVHTIIGFAVYYQTFATTTGKKGIHLDDFYIEPAFRGNGYGKRFMHHLAKIASGPSFARFEWLCVRKNYRAVGFYRSIGAQALEELSLFRMDDQAIRKFVEES